MAGRSSTRRERTARDSRIRKAAARGQTIEEIAVAEKVSARTVFRVLGSRPAVGEADLDVPELLEIDAFAELARAVAVHRDAAERLRQIAATGRNESASVGAARSAAAVARDLIALLTSAGLLPQTPFAWRTEAQWQRAWDALFAAAESAGLDPNALEADLQRRLTSGNTDVALTGLGPAPDLELAA